MPSWKKPTPELVPRAIALLGHVEHYRHFFDRLENPRWLTPLSKRGFFKNPPAAVRDEAEGTVAFPPWPESRYLARMARHDSAAVVAIMQKIPDTDNVRVHEDLAEAILAMPAQHGAQWGGRETRWVKKQAWIYPLLPEKLGAVISHFARGGEVKAAQALARALLTPAPAAPNAARPSTGFEISPTESPRARFDLWFAEKLFNQGLPDLVAAAGMQAVVLLCGLLDESATRGTRSGVVSELADHSEIWRPDINGGSLDDTLRDRLVSALRNACEVLVTKDPSSLRSMLSTLEKPFRYPQIRHRLALYVLHRHPEHASLLIRERLFDRRLLWSVACQNEYLTLLRDQFDNFEDKERLEWLRLIEEGPSLSVSDLSAAESEELSTASRVTRLAAIADKLPTEWRAQHPQWTADLTLTEDFRPFSIREAEFVGPISPKGAEELRSMNVTTIVSFLKLWQPSGQWREASTSGLAGVLEGVVAGEHERFVDEIDQFKCVQAAYIRSLLSGVVAALKKGNQVRWQPLVEFCHWAVKQPAEGRGVVQEHGDRDHEWSWTRRIVLELLSEGLLSDVNEINQELRAAVWQVLLPLTNDPDPTPAYELQYGGATSDPVTLCLNSIRGQAMLSVIRYGLWVKRFLDSEHGHKDETWCGFVELPEVRRVLEHHLDAEREPSVAVRAAYGWCVPLLYSLDKTWLTTEIDRIFPQEQEHRHLWRAAWEAYVVFCDPHSALLSILGEEYDRAINEIGSTQEKPATRAADPDERLAEHVMLLYLRGKVAHEDEDGILTRFFAKAPEALRAHAIEYVGRLLKNHKGAVPSDLVLRLRTLWEWRFARASARKGVQEFHGEAAAFGWWFVSGQFDDEWALNKLLEALKVSESVEPAPLVLQQLGKMARAKSRVVVKCLRRMIEGDKEGWRVLGHVSELRGILSAAISSGDGEALAAATEVVNLLGRRGLGGFGDLLRGSKR